MLLLAMWLGIESIRQLIDPAPVVGALVLIAALAGVAVDLLMAWSMSKANRSSLNAEGAFQHLHNDLYAFIATAIAGLIIVLTGFTLADGIATLLVVALMIKAELGLVRAPGRIVLEAAPPAWTRPRSAHQSSPCPASPKSTTCTSGRSPPASRDSPPAS